MAYNPGPAMRDTYPSHLSFRPQKSSGTWPAITDHRQHVAHVSPPSPRPLPLYKPPLSRNCTALPSLLLWCVHRPVSGVAARLGESPARYPGRADRGRRRRGGGCPLRGGPGFWRNAVVRCRADEPAPGGVWISKRLSRGERQAREALPVAALKLRKGFARASFRLKNDPRCALAHRLPHIAARRTAETAGPDQRRCRKH
ncbi:hypothetical protein GQ53DRAFT_106327 [Thozetella sp. PMI_491]|nr:hypothetical protein GQ53DRAFT_106327 [Thozetella sp. PMI_491]